MTKAGVPTTRAMKMLIPKVLKGDLPEALRSGKQAAVTETETKQLVRAVRAATADFGRCVQLLNQLESSRSRYLERMQVDQAAMKRYVDNRISLVAQLWREGVTDQAVVDEAFMARLRSPVELVKAALLNEATVSALEARLEAEWVAPNATLASVNELLSQSREHAYFHNEIPQSTWSATLDWVAENQDCLRAAAELFSLTQHAETRPGVLADRGTKLRPLDRAIETRVVRLVTSTGYVGNSVAPVALLNDEVDCAVAPLGLASHQAQAVVLLAGRLVIGRTFNQTADTVADLRRSTAPEHSAYLRMVRMAWRFVRGLADGEAGPLIGIRWEPELEERIGYRGDALGLQRLENPDETFMARVWARAHGKDHAGVIDKGEAERIIRASWTSWLRDTAQDMGKPPTSSDVEAWEPDQPSGSSDAHLLCTQLHELVTNPLVSELLRRLATGNAAEFQTEWTAVVGSRNWPREELEASGVLDAGQVQDYLLTHLYNQENS